jgi:hypothetical protein
MITLDIAIKGEFTEELAGHKIEVRHHTNDNVKHCFSVYDKTTKKYITTKCLFDIKP